MERLSSEGLSFLAELQRFGENLLKPWSLYQIVILIGLFGIAHFATRKIIDPALRSWLGRLEKSRPEWLSGVRVITNRAREILLSCWLWQPPW